MPCAGPAAGRGGVGGGQPREPRAGPPALEVARDERDQPGEVVGVPIAGGVGLPEAEGRGACEAAEDVVRGDGHDDRVARPAPLHTPVREPQLERAVLDTVERPDRRTLGDPGPDPAAGGELAQRLCHGFSDPCRGRTAACGRTRRVSARASPPGGGSELSPGAASAGSGAWPGRGSRRSAGVAAR